MFINSLKQTRKIWKDFPSSLIEKLFGEVQTLPSIWVDNICIFSYKKFVRTMLQHLVLFAFDSEFCSKFDNFGIEFPVFVDG